MQTVKATSVGSMKYRKEAKPAISPTPRIFLGRFFWGGGWPLNLVATRSYIRNYG